jgi:hypothetical protein
MQLTYIQHVYKHTSHADEKHIIILILLFTCLSKNFIQFSVKKYDLLLQNVFLSFVQRHHKT